MTILIFRIGYLGDTIVSLPVLRAIRRQYAGSKLILLTHTEPSASQFLADVCRRLRLVDEIETYRAGGSLGESLCGWVRLRQGLVGRSIDEVIYLPPSRRSRMALWRDKWIFRGCGLSRVRGIREFKPTPERDAQGRLMRLPAEGQWLRDHAERIGIHITAEDLQTLTLAAPDEERRVQAALVSGPNRPKVAFCTGAKTSAQRWPLERFKGLGQSLIERFDIEPIFVGADQDSQDAQTLITAWGRGQNFCGGWNIFETSEVLKRCVLYIGHDTGPMHLAAYAGTRCVGIFSARNNPGVWEPGGTGHAVIRKSVPCEGCHQDACPTPGHPCMTQISPEEVFSAAERYFK